MKSTSNSIINKIKITSVDSIFVYCSKKGGGNKRINRPKWAMALKFEGESIYKNLGKTHVSNLHNLIILPKGSNYEWLSVKEGKCYMLEFDCDLTSEEIYVFNLHNSEKFIQLFKDAEYKKNLNSPTSDLETIVIVYQILIALLKSTQKEYLSTKTQEKILPAIEYILKNYDKPIKNDELARLTGFSTVYFRKLFTKCYGVSPIVYIHQLRISKGKEMLKSEGISITEVSDTLGYQNIYDFSRTFKKHVGLSPSKYIKQYNEEKKTS